MATVIRGGQGFSTAFPKGGDVIISRGGGGGGGSSISVSGGTVTIGGKGYSVAPTLQEEFIKGRGGIINQQVQQQIQAEIARQQQARQAEQARQEALRKEQQALERQRQKAQTLAQQQALQRIQQINISQQQKLQQQNQVIPTSDIKVRTGGGVSVGRQTFVGKSLVPGSGGKTAQQIRTETFKEARQQLGSGVKAGGYTATIPTLNTETLFDTVKETKTQPEDLTFSQAVQQGVQQAKEKRYLIDIDRINIDKYPKKETIKDIIKYKDIKVHSPGTIYQVQTGIIEGIPEVKTQIVKSDWSSRPVTSEEGKYFEEYKKAQDYESIASKDAPSKLSTIYGEEKGRVTKLMAEPLIDKSWIEQTSAKGGKAGEFIGGAVYGAVGTKGAAIQTAVIYGATAGAGFAIKGVTSGTTYGATRLFGATAGKYVGTSLKVGTTGAGAYLGATYSYKQLESIKSTPSYFEKGSITGRTASDVAAGFYGFKTGSKGWDITEGLIRRRGLPDVTKIATDPLVESGKHKFVEISKSEYKKLSQPERGKLYKELFEGDYPEIKKLIGYTGEGTKIKYSKSLPFKIEKGTDIQRALGVKRGGIHVTDQPGSYAELIRAIHIAPKASTGFGGLDSKGSSRYIPSLKELFSPPSKPGLVWFEAPKGFKYVKGLEYKRGSYKWDSRLPSGKKAYIPGSKPEIEAVFDISVTKGFEPIQYKGGYIKTQGVSVPFTGAYKPIEIPKVDIFAKDFDKININVPSSIGYESPALFHPSAGVISYSYLSTPTKIDSIISTPSPSYSTTPTKVSSIISTPSYSKSISSISTSSYKSSKPTSSKPSSSKSSLNSLYNSIPSSKPSSSKSSLSNLYSSYVSSSKGSSSSYSPVYDTSKKPLYKPTSQPKYKPRPSKRFTVQVRRFGQFKPIGTFGSLGKAFDVGRQRVSESLAATFKIDGKTLPGLPKGFYAKQTPGGTLFIEKRSKRLSKRGEKSEIQQAKRKKKKMKRRSKK